MLRKKEPDLLPALKGEGFSRRDGEVIKMMKLAEDYLNRLKKIEKQRKEEGKKSVAKPYRYILKEFAKWLAKKDGKENPKDEELPTYLENFEIDDVKDFMEHLRREKGVRTANLFLSAVRQYALFRAEKVKDDKAFREEHQKYLSLMKIKPFKVPREFVKRTLNPDELAKLLKMTADKPILQAGIMTAFYFGWRPVEGAYNLAFARIDWEERYMIIRTAKTDNERILPWHEDITPYLQKWYDAVKNEISKLEYPDEWLTKHLKPYGRKFGLNLTAKTARRTFETWMKKMKVEQWMIDFLMGHKENVSSEYADWLELVEDLREPMEKKHYMIVHEVLDYAEI